MNKPSEREIREIIDEILSRPAFGGTAGQVEENAPMNFELELESRPLPRASGSAALPTAAIAVFVVVAALLVFVLVRGERGRRRTNDDRVGGDAAIPPDPMQAALDLAGQGDYAAALIQLFLLHLRALRDGGWIAIERSKTNAQYEMELLQGGYRDLDNFRRFKQLFNSVRYGGRGLDAAAFESWLGYCRQPPERRWPA